MTAKVSQIVVPRHRASVPFTQRGSVNHGTITVVFSCIALCVVSLLGFFYLQQVIDTASQGADIHALQSEISTLKEQQRTLELQGAQIRSLQTVQDRVQKLNLVQSNQMSYLASESDRVALISQ